MSISFRRVTISRSAPAPCASRNRAERHGARLPFDFFLRSLAEEVGERAICVILSGTGGDGSLGLKAVKEKGGLVIAQDPGRGRV